MTAQNQTDTNLELDQSRHVQAQFIELFGNQNKRGQVAVFLCSVMLYFLIRQRIGFDWATSWLVLIATINGFRFIFSEQIVRSASKPIVMIGLLLFLQALGMVLPLLAFANVTDIDRAAITMVFIALSTGAMTSTSGYRGIYLYSAATLLLPLGMAWVLYTPSGDNLWAGRALGGLIFLYLAYLAATGKEAYKVFDESCRIRFDGQGLNKRLADALDKTQQANQAKTKFLAAASHDLRQPLHTISMLVTAIGLRKLDARNREIVDMLGAVSQSLSSQLDGLLDVSMLDAGIVHPVFQPVDISQIARSHVATIELAARTKGLYVKANCATPLHVLTDSNLLLRILSNLTSNALKFTEAGGIDVCVTQDGDDVVLEVLDTGVGIASHQQALVFQEFYQVANDERDRSKGLGLGLALVDRTCKLLKITLTLESALGRGSCLKLRMPLIDTVPAFNSAPRTTPTASLDGLRVLVIDDEADVRVSLKLLLDELGCHAALTNGYEAAQQLANIQHFDMVISDFRLKGDKDGVDAIRRVNKACPNIYALLITGDTAPERLQQAHAANVELLHKPLNLTNLLKHLHAAKGMAVQHASHA